MANTLVTWELGAGLGHLVNLLPLVRGLLARGHRVFAAVRDLSKAERVFGSSGISYLQAPIQTRSPAYTIEPPRSFAHILHNNGFGDPGELRAMAGAWRNLFEMVAPALVVFDHSPTALLAARGLPAKKALIGTGFFCPLDEYPLADLRGGAAEVSVKLRQDEDRVCASANAVLADWGAPPLERLARLFYDVDENFLATLPELEHYAGRRGTLIRPALTPGPSPASGRGEMCAPGPSPTTMNTWCPGRGEKCAPGPAPNGDEGRSKARRDRLETYPTAAETRYWGVWPNVGGRLPEWPAGEGKRVFAYVKPFSALPRLLQQLCDLCCATIVHGDGADDNLRQRFRSATTRFEDQPLDMAETARTCDLAILNGNHGSTVSMLLAGKPTLQLPIALEQGLFSQVVARLGAAVVAMHDQPREVVAALMEMLGSERYAEAAWQFAARYAGYDPKQQIAAIIDRAEELLRS